MIDRYIQWLLQHRWINLILVLGYVLFLVFAHEWFVSLSVKVMNSLSLDLYNKLVAGITALGLATILASVVWLLGSKTTVQRSGIVFMLVILAALCIHFFVFTEMNIEFIHAMEFGLLAAFIYPLVGRYGAAAVYALPVMLFDEWYQYQVLFDYVEYFDFNDILLDLLGAGLVLSLLKTFNSVSYNSKSLVKRHEFYALLFMITAVSFLLLSSIIVPYPEQHSKNTLLILNEIQEAYGFWRKHPLIGSSYHVLEPITGLITVFTVCSFYLMMDPMSSKK